MSTRRPLDTPAWLWHNGDAAYLRGPARPSVGDAVQALLEAQDAMAQASARQATAIAALAVAVASERETLPLPNMGEGLPEWLSVDQAAEWLNVGRDALYEGIRQGTVPAVQLGRQKRIAKGAVIRIAAQQISAQLSASGQKVPA